MQTQPVILQKNEDGNFVLGDTELKLIEDVELEFENGKAEGIARCRLTLPVLTSLGLCGQESPQGQQQ